MDDLWIFGYGSLIFKADFPYRKKLPATLTGWSRRFWQASTDHRGTPEFAGRVVTLTPAPHTDCWGMAYQISAKDVDWVLDHLDYREKNGYQRLDENVRFENGDTSAAITYLADANNFSFLGEAPILEMAQQIVQAQGPSGKNIDYLFLLERSLAQHGQMDEHVLVLANAARELLLSSELPTLDK